MIGRKNLVRIELFELVIFLLIHVVYALFFMDEKTATLVSVYALVVIVCAAVDLICIKNLTKSQTIFVICVMVATQLIGGAMGSLAMGICIYMITGVLVAIAGESKINIRYIIITNIAIIVGLVTEYNVITRFVPIRYYVLMILFLETFLFTESYMVLLYQQKVEEIQTKNELLNIAQQSKNQFLANMSHEIRTPMNAIVGMSELIMREHDASDKIREYCYNIQSSGENLLGIINDILDFSKVESGKMDIVYEPYSFASLIQDVTNTTMFRKGYKDIDIVIDCSPNMPKALIGDELRIRQIFINIVNNAIKFTDKGYVYIELSCVEVDGRNVLRFKVEDTGIGIKKENQVHLFEAFNRTDYLKNRYVEGTGLGLAICKQLIRLMHGTIKLYSEYEKGTTVIVDIPQEIADGTPFMKLKEEQTSVAVYVDKEHHMKPGDSHYHDATMKMWSDLKIGFREITDFSDVIQGVEDGSINNLFIGELEYHDQQNYFEQISQKINLYVTHSVQTPIRLPKTVKEILLPFYSVNVISAMNGEPLYSQFIDEKSIKIVFQAPAARVLVVDDNDINLRVAEGILKLFSIDVVLVHSGKEAIERLNTPDIDLVLMDHMMPELDGIETTEIIRRTLGEYGKTVPIVAMTANVVNDAKSMFLDSGFQDFLPKPVTLKDMNTILRKWLPGTKLVFKNDNERKQIIEFDVSNSEENRIDDSQENSFVPMEVNEAVALENMGGMRDLYKELLEYSIEMKEERLAEIQESFDEKNYEEYQIRVHALKGAMRSLGVEELALAAQAQEFACKENRIEDMIETHPFFLEEFERGHKSIEKFLETMEI